MKVLLAKTGVPGVKPLQRGVPCVRRVPGFNPLVALIFLVIYFLAFMKSLSPKSESARG